MQIQSCKKRQICQIFLYYFFELANVLVTHIRTSAVFTSGINISTIFFCMMLVFLCWYSWYDDNNWGTCILYGVARNVARVARSAGELYEYTTIRVYEYSLYSERVNPEDHCKIWLRSRRLYNTCLHCDFTECYSSTFNIPTFNIPTYNIV